MKTTVIFAALIFAISCIDTKQTDAQMYIECLNNIDGTDGECQFCYDQFNKGQFLTYQDALNEANKTRQPQTW